MTKPNYDLFGIGIGPFNLSLAALLRGVPATHYKFVDQKRTFEWHPEMMFGDSYMQTSYLKDLVTPVDPTNPFSFLNYLVKNGLFHAFMNTERGIVSRREFERYCQWVSQNLGESLQFGTGVHEVRFENDQFIIETTR
ncbi:MAG: lysine 6-monooxygenase, partial [Proteobacteria bacterium]